MKIPENLIQKYNVPVPRYTSYTPANYFHENFGPEDYIKAIEASNSEWPENISLYIHIPFCSKMCHFCGCNTQYTRDKGKMGRYVEAVKKEIKMVKKLLEPARKVSQVHWGGGTPNTLPIEMIRGIMDLIHESFSFIEKPEIAIECHPAMLDESYTGQLVLAGFNRFSLGIQDFKQEVLDNVNRTAMTIKTSFNDCESWSSSKLVYAGPSAYSCLVKLPNGEVGLIFEAGEKRPYEKMVFVSFKIKELFTPGTFIEEI